METGAVLLEDSADDLTRESTLLTARGETSHTPEDERSR